MFPTKQPQSPIEAMQESGKAISQSSLEWDKIASYLVGTQHKYREHIIIPRMIGAAQMKTRDEVMVERAMESCVFKSIMSCVIGYGLGAAIGLFSSSVNPNMTSVEKQQTAREIFREMRITTTSYAKNFAVIGCLFTAVECTIESYRGKTEWKNSAYAGGVTGALIGLRAGLKASIAGGLSFAAFSIVIDRFMHSS